MLKYVSPIQDLKTIFLIYKKKKKTFSSSKNNYKKKKLFSYFCKLSSPSQEAKYFWKFEFYIFFGEKGAGGVALKNLSLIVS